MIKTSTPIEVKQLQLDVFNIETCIKYQICNACKESKSIEKYYFKNGRYLKKCKLCMNRKKQHNKMILKLTEKIKELENIQSVFQSNPPVVSKEDIIRLNDERKKELSKLKYKLYRLQNWENIRNRESNYLKTQSGRETKCKSNQKRLKSFGFKPINHYFEGSEYHHLHNNNGKKDNSIGIFIPSKLHQSIHHNSVTGKGIDKMNKVALE